MVSIPYIEKRTITSENGLIVFDYDMFSNITHNVFHYEAFCLQVWTLKLDLKNEIPGRERQDSPAIVDEGMLNENLLTIRFGSFVKAAYHIYQQIFYEKSHNFDYAFPNFGPWVECFPDCLDKNDNPVDINYILNLKMDLKTTVNSLKQGYEITSGGYINKRQRSEDAQITKITKQYQ